jgi:hypothetical protein
MTRSRTATTTAAPAPAAEPTAEHLPAVAAPSAGALIVSDAPDIAPAMAPRWLTPQSLDAALQLADMMAKARMVPEHLRNSPGDCLLVVSQAARWGIDPFAVAQATAIVRGKLCYEGKLVATVLRATGAIVGRLDYAFDGSGDGMSVTVSGTPRGGKRESLTGTVAQWRTQNENWARDPQSMLVYRGTRQWARLYAPEAMLGVVTPDELEEPKDAVVLGGSPGVTPTASWSDAAPPPAQPATTAAPAPTTAAPTPAPTAAAPADAAQRPGPQPTPEPTAAALAEQFQALAKNASQRIANLFWNRWKSATEKAARLDAMKRANTAITAVRSRLGAAATNVLQQILDDREDPDNALGILGDLERAVAPAAAAASAAPAPAADDAQPPF